jgi:hypothetical protein
MARAILTITLKTKYLFCPTCSVSPVNLTQPMVEKFLKKHAKHSNNLYDRYTRLVGYVKEPKLLRGKKVAIKFIDERSIKKEKKKLFKCHSKDCEYYKEGVKEFCSAACKANHEDYKRQKRKRRK